MENDLQQRIIKAILEIDEEETLRLTRKALKEKVPPEKIIGGLSEGLRQMGNLFEKGERFIPELVIAAEFVNKAFKILEPHLSPEEGKAGGWRSVKVVIATVEGDIHDLGKNLVATMLSAAGFQVIDLGKDVAAKTIVSKVKETNAGCGSIRPVNNHHGASGRSNKITDRGRNKRKSKGYDRRRSRFPELGGTDRCRRIRGERYGCREKA